MTDVDLKGRSEAELAALIVEAAADPDGGWDEAEQLGQAIAKVGPVGIRALEGLFDHPDEYAAVGAIQGLMQVSGWSRNHTDDLRRMVFGSRPPVAARSLDALIGYEDGDVCYLPAIADDVVRLLAGHESSDVRSSLIYYVSICEPERHFDTLLPGLSDLEASVRHTAVAGLGYLTNPELVTRAGPHVWLRLDDVDLEVRDWAQLFMEGYAWPSPDNTEWVAFTDDHQLLTYSRTRVHLDPRDNQGPDMVAFAVDLRADQPQAVRRGAADELEEQTMTPYDESTELLISDLAELYAEDGDQRVRQAMSEIIKRSKGRG